MAPIRAATRSANNKTYACTTWNNCAFRWIQHETSLCPLPTYVSNKSTNLPTLLTTKFHQISIFSSNFQIFMSMGPTWRSLKLWPQNFSEADTCTIWNYNMKSQTGQKENANDWQTFEHRPKMWKFPTKKIGPRFTQTGACCYRAVLLYKRGFSKTVSTSHFAKADTLRIWNYISLPMFWRAEIEIWWLDPEKSWFFQNFRRDSYRPKLITFCPDV